MSEMRTCPRCGKSMPADVPAGIELRPACLLSAALTSPESLDVAGDAAVQQTVEIPREVLRSVWAEPFASEAVALFRHTLDTGEPYVATRTVERRQDVAEVEAYDWRIERIVLPDGRVAVEVRDTGAGIDAAVLPRIFDAFEQGEVRSASQQAGLGLGLAISRKLAEAHGGTITARSEGRGRGATFTVELPLTDAPLRVGLLHSPTQVLTASRPLNVLLVEDHEPTLRVMEWLLRQSGHRVTGVTSVASATAAARQDGFDLIISDLGLPDGSGLDIIRELRDRYAGRSIALTGYGMESDMAASRAAGFTEHLTKPVDLAALDAAIRRVSSSSH